MPRQVRDSAARDERGAVALTVVGLIVPFLLIGAFVVDLGMAYAQAQAFASGADSAALAVAREKQDDMNEKPTTLTNCGALLADDPDAARAGETARRQVQANRPFDLSEDDITVNVRLACVPVNGGPAGSGVLKVTVDVTREVPTALGKVAGVDSIRAARTGNAGVSGARRVGGVFPLAICDKQANAIRANPTATTTIETDKVWQPGCATGNAGGGNGGGNNGGGNNGGGNGGGNNGGGNGGGNNGGGNGGGNNGGGSNSGAGNWGWLDCGATNNSTQGLADRIRNGCTLPPLAGNPASVQMGGQPGNRDNAGPVRDAMQDKVGDSLAFPVYDLVTSQGSGAEYRVVGFITLKIIAITNGEVTVQYQAYSPTAEFDGSCGLGAGCASYNVTAVGLIG
ncbi:pilus assembly protein [Phycicoccus sp. BSK3Z-2]|uniref:Pilus assembly protein n=1 Tax=Phycicoccus avicenniae TaxID=2828860 RepID=A0A941D864_9MICO|nr:TadE/TadG family type IV pilus assembly protein [Phycicoccus avicenniae]MBR7743894.1 pilus assembly protein [Phycicoccus avicenniae]